MSAPERWRVTVGFRDAEENPLPSWTFADMVPGHWTSLPEGAASFTIEQLRAESDPQTFAFEWPPPQ